jgi:hypothetical protein
MDGTCSTRDMLAIYRSKNVKVKPLVSGPELEGNPMSELGGEKVCLVNLYRETALVASYCTCGLRKGTQNFLMS